MSKIFISKDVHEILRSTSTNAKARSYFRKINAVKLATLFAAAAAEQALNSNVLAFTLLATYIPVCIYEQAFYSKTHDFFNKSATEHLKNRYDIEVESSPKTDIGFLKIFTSPFLTYRAIGLTENSKKLKIA